MTFKETFAFTILAPFSLDLSAIVFSNGDCHVRGYQNGVFTQVLCLKDQLVLAQAKQVGDVHHPALEVELQSNQQITRQTKQAAQDALTYIFSLNFPLEAFYSQTQNDSTMRQITRQLCGFKFPTTPTAFEGLVDAIVEQQISIKVARTIEERLAARLGDRIEIDGEAYSAFPTPQKIAGVSLDEVQGCGLSRRKAEYIQNAAKLIVEGTLDLEAMKQNPNDEETIRALDEIKGIGVWTAELTVLRGMQRYDVLPADDFGLRRVISTYYREGVPIKAPEAREIAMAWGKFSGLAAFYLIVAEVKGIQV